MEQTPFDKITVHQQVKEFPTIYGTKDTDTCPYPEPDKSSPCPHILFLLYLFFTSFMLRFSTCHHKRAYPKFFPKYQHFTLHKSCSWESATKCRWKCINMRMFPKWKEIELSSGGGGGGHDDDDGDENN